MESRYHRFCTAVEKRLPLLTVLGFLLGIAACPYFPSLVQAMRITTTTCIRAYAFAAPAILFVILTPSLVRFLSARSSLVPRFLGHAMTWLAVSRWMALVFSTAFCAWVLRLSPTSSREVDILQPFYQALHSLSWMATHSTYFFAMAAAVVAAIFAKAWPSANRYTSHWIEKVELLGQHFIPLVPFFMFTVGVYLFSLSPSFNNPAQPAAHAVHLHPLHVLGLKIDAATPGGILSVYLAASLLTALCCLLWQCLLLGICKICVKNFSIAYYFWNYWIRIYPTLWATCSESLSTPLNLHLVKTYYPGVHPEVRQVVVGTGSIFNINGTMICAIVLLAVVANLLGIPISWIQLIACMPLIFLVGFGVPGIPGELLMFAGPLVMLLGIPEPAASAFLALYLGLQLGLPDSFRTGTNSTDSCLFALLLNEHSRQRLSS